MLCDVFNPRRLFSFAILSFLNAYKSFLSPVFVSLGYRCKYHPSCSSYAQQAFSTMPPQKALFLSAWRLLRCNPFSAGGFDPLPTNLPQNTYPFNSTNTLTNSPKG